MAERAKIILESVGDLFPSHHREAFDRAGRGDEPNVRWISPDDARKHWPKAADVLDRAVEHIVTGVDYGRPGDDMSVLVEMRVEADGSLTMLTHREIFSRSGAMEMHQDPVTRKWGPKS